MTSVKICFVRLLCVMGLFHLYSKLARKNDNFNYFGWQCGSNTILIFSLLYVEFMCMLCRLFSLQPFKIETCEKQTKKREAVVCKHSGHRLKTLFLLVVGLVCLGWFWKIIYRKKIVWKTLKKSNLVSWCPCVKCYEAKRKK